MRRPILNHTHRGELVYDPFLGSGTTLAACELTERVCNGLEIDPRYVDVILTRWQKLVGKQARLEGDGRTFEEIRAERTAPATADFVGAQKEAPEVRVKPPAGEPLDGFHTRQAVPDLHQP